MRALSFASVLGAVAFAAANTASISSVKSSVTLLFQNNLNYTDDSHHIAALLLHDLLDYADASKACAALGETLLPVSTVQQHVADILPELEYLAYKKIYAYQQAYWIGSAMVVTASGTSKVSYFKASQKDKFPVLCTQSSVGTTETTSVVTAQNTLSIMSNSNTFVGFRNLKSFRFIGIPYANPTPRWTYSTVYSAKDQIINATAFGPSCVQQYAGPPLSEQCQYLNVFTPYIPASTSANLKPVLVWIHGGAFTSGAGSDPTIDGGNMASRGDVVVVTINYRLSTLGFLALPGTNITGNYGLADQITAIEWVQENIAAFGGDPKQITIGGQSAGAGSVRALLASPVARGKFVAAIPGSNLDGMDYAATYSNYYTTQEEATVAGNLIPRCPAWKRSMRQHFVNLATVARYVIVDGKYITSDQLEVTEPSQVAHVPTMWGTMADDGAAFIGYPSASMNASTAIMDLNYLSANLTKSIVDSGLFPVPNTGNYTLDLFNVSARVATDIQFRCLDQATVYSAVKHNAFGQTFYYQFDRSYQTPGFDPNAPVCDAPKTAAYPNGDPNLPYFHCHSGDLYYEFGTLGQFGYPYRDTNDLVFSQLIMDYWTSFIRTHNPNPDPGYLDARGYTNTVHQTSLARYWNPVTNSRTNLNRLSVPSSQSEFLEIKQCAVLGQPLDYYEQASS